MVPLSFVVLLLRPQLATTAYQMRIQDQVTLFQRIELADLSRKQEAAARGVVNSVSDRDVQIVPAHGVLTANILEPLRIQVPQILGSDERRAFDEPTEVGDDYGGRLQATRRFAELKIGFTGDPQAFDIKPPSMRYTTVLRAYVDRTAVRRVISINNKDTAQARSELDAFLRDFKAALETLRSDVNKSEMQLRERIMQMLDERGRRVTELAELSSQL
jgi:hypothetical protein